MINNERGLVSLISTTIISLLLVIVTVAMIYVAVNVSQQATKSDLSSRAYYAAESGAEEEVHIITDYIQQHLNQPVALVTSSCTNSAVGTSGQAYVCRTVSNQATVISDQAAADEANQYQIPSPTVPNPLADIYLEWNLPLQDSAQTGGCSPCNNLTASPWTAPAVMELTSIVYPSGAFNSSVMHTYVVAPGNTGLPGSTATTDVIGGSCSGSVSPQLPYNCSATIPISPAAGSNYIFRLIPRYKGTHFRLTFRDGVGAGSSPIQVTDSKATIDVTAKAGDVLRRVSTKVKIRSGVLSGLDYSLYSDTDLCKTFQVNPAVPVATPTPTGGVGSCPP